MADEHRMLIAGGWTGSESGATFEATSPSTGEVIGTLPEGTRGDVRRAVAAADLFFEATVVDGVTDEMQIAREETFGPVVPVHTIRHEEEAIALVDGSEYGLLSAIFTADLGRALRFAEHVRTGWVNVNEGTNYWESHLPFGGRAGSASGVGRVGGRFSIERLTELKTIVMHLG